MALGLLVAVEHDGLGTTLAGLAADKGVLSAFAIAGEIGEGAIRLGNGGIILLDAAAHLRHQAGLELLRSGESCGCISILLLQAGPDLRIENRRILENFLPVLCLQPSIIIPDLHPVYLE